MKRKPVAPLIAVSAPPEAPSPANPERLLYLREVAYLTAKQPSTVYAHIKKGSFPPPLKYGRSSRWKLSEIQAYINGTYTPAPASPVLKLVRKGGKV